MFQLIVSLAIAAIISFYFDHVWGLVALGFLLLALIQNRNDAKPDKNQGPVDPPHFKRRGTKDYVRFVYTTLEGKVGTYTVAVTFFDKDKFGGYCYERKDKRSFFYDSVKDSEIIRLQDGEVTDVNNWLDSL